MATTRFSLQTTALLAIFFYCLLVLDRHAGIIAAACGRGSSPPHESAAPVLVDARACRVAFLFLSTRALVTTAARSLIIAPRLPRVRRLRDSAMRRLRLPSRLLSLVAHRLADSRISNNRGGRLIYFRDGARARARAASANCNKQQIRRPRANRRNN